MFSEIEKPDYKNLLPLLHSVPRDPMLYMLIEGYRPGRIFVDNSSRPSVALIWSRMEYAYLVGDSSAMRDNIVGVVENIIMPVLNEIGLDFVTIFPFDTSPTEIQGWFPKRRPVSFGVNAFTFEKDRFNVKRTKAKTLPPGYNLTRLDVDTLNQNPYQGILEDILFCWDSLDRFYEIGLGYSIENEENRVVSACYAIGYGANAYHIDIWTHQEHRLKGLARNTAIAFLDECLQVDRTIYWINDAPNVASRCLAESLGFLYTGDLATVDIPVHPYHFHLSLAEHFIDYLGLYRGAGELYDMAFDIQEGNSVDYRKAAQVWRQVGDEEKAKKYEQKVD